MRDSSELFDEYMDTPLAELEAYGISIRLLDGLERNLKVVRVRDMEHVTMAMMRNVRHLPRYELKRFYKALDLLRDDIINGTDQRLPEYRKWDETLKPLVDAERKDVMIREGIRL